MRRRRPAPSRVGGVGKKADDERAGDIDEERAPREGLAHPPGDDTGEPETGDAAERTPQSHEEICEHKKTPVKASVRMPLTGVISAETVRRFSHIRDGKPHCQRYYL